MRLFIVLAYITLLLLVSCAQIVTPTGGPKDETAPKVIGEFPANRSVNLKAKEIEIKFDEFIVFQQPNENVIISPPMRKNPEYRLKRKSLIIKLKEELTPDATYIINFGEAIRDNNEGNILNNYTYVFSTGAVLDSMELRGTLTDAITADPVEGAMLMLYANDVDSLPRTTLPDYFARTGKDGQFHITNIRNLPYKLFALKDQNTNYRFDVPDEMIGFVDTLVRPTPMQSATVVDSMLTTDSLAVRTDSLATAIDSLTVTSPDSSAGGLKTKSGRMITQVLNVRMFTEQDTTQFLKKSASEHYGKLMFVYNRPVSRFTALLPSGKVAFKKQWAIKEFSAKRDTVTLWTTDAAPDTLDLILNADGRRDTVQLVMKSREAALQQGKGSGKRGAQNRTSKFALTLQTEPPTGRPPLPGTPLQLIWSHPVVDIDLAGIDLREDSIPVNFDLTSADTSLRRFSLFYPWKKGQKYDVVVMDSAATDIFGLRNDTIRLAFTGISAEELGDITLNITNLNGRQKLIELVNASKKTVATRTVRTDGPIQFTKLEAGKYAFVVVDDLNNNGRWDSGRYAYHLQPEPIFFLKTDIDVRANWQMELDWDANELKTKN